MVGDLVLVIATATRTPHRHVYTGERMSAMPTKARRGGAGGALGVVVAVVVYAVVALTLVGWAWPYPSRLPDTFSFHGKHVPPGQQRLQAACLVPPAAGYQRRPHPSPPRSTLPSALWFGSRPLYSYYLDPSFSNTYDWVLVQDGSCYRSYGGDLQL